jgi:hypothetical protein
LDEFAILMEHGVFSVYYVRRANSYIVSGGFHIYATDNDFEALIIKSIAEYHYLNKEYGNVVLAA